VVGPAGIGKSRLLAELGARADARGHVVLSGSGAELEQDLPYWVFVDALDDHVDGLDSRRLEQLDATIRSELGQLLPALAASAAAPEAALDERYRTHRAARLLLEQLAMPKPLCSSSTTSTGPTPPRPTCSARCCAGHQPQGF
jgi:predicted ATPase